MPFSFSPSTVLRIVLWLLFVDCSIVVGAPLQSIADRPFITRVEQLEDPAYADWITAPSSIDAGIGVYLFRKTFELGALPAAFVVHVSADPRYRLFVNGALVTLGPAAGDLSDWRYETIDLSPFLQIGKNVIAVELWNPGSLAGARQISARMGLVLKGPNLPSGRLLTDGSWKVARDAGWSALHMDDATVGGGYAAGATQRLDGSKHPWGWARPEFDDSGWALASILGKGSHGNLNTWGGTPWALQARPIPLLEITNTSAGVVREITPVSLPKTWPVLVPPHTQMRLLIDRGFVDLGFPQLTVSGGSGAEIMLRYQEALFRLDGSKGHRSELNGKVMKGYFDRFFPDGGEQRVFEPVWVRTYRFLEISVMTGKEPLTLVDASLRRVRYPFRRVGTFACSDPSLPAIMEACWRTADLCAGETYMDCPYYEQAQYVGDTRIQALISLYLTGDDRLMRNAIRQFDASRQPYGLTKSAHPTGGAQIIPPFSLLFISMVHDYHMYRRDAQFVRELLPGIRYTLEWFLARIDERNLLGPLPFWNHTDGGAAGFQHGSPPGASTGGSIQLTLLLASTLDDAADLFAFHAREREAEEFRAVAVRLKAAARRFGYNEARGLYAETPELAMYSQHVNAGAILSGTVLKAEQSALAERLATDSSLIQGSLYFQHYVFEALREAGRGELMLPLLRRWTDMLDAGLTTFPEHGPESRSDVHAWAAHPLYHLLSTTAGVRPTSPGFRSVRVSPALGHLTWLEAVVCHPDGVIKVRYDRDAAGAWIALVELPPGVNGTLDWRGEAFALEPGGNRIKLSP